MSGIEVAYWTVSWKNKMPLEPEFVQYLASLNCSEAEFNALPVVERSSIRRNFSPVKGYYIHPVNLIQNSICFDCLIRHFSS